MDNEKALITDFGLSKILDDNSSSDSNNNMPGRVVMRAYKWNSPFNKYKSCFQKIQAVLENNRKKVIPGTPSDYISLYEKCWSFDPDKHPIINEVLTELRTLANLSIEFITSKIEDNQEPGYEICFCRKDSRTENIWLSPFYDTPHDTKLTKKIIDGYRPVINENITPQIIFDLWSKNPEDRPEAIELLDEFCSFRQKDNKIWYQIESIEQTMNFEIFPTETSLNYETCEQALYTSTSRRLSVHNVQYCLD
ncbi:serine/threonine protein kinase [Gigaspora margarita]|uniref:Serine/threonine protein kinase n=1 Tax=Gigaspora margarita TaxID=4874 RepID=A0A8H4A2Y8_GIGMA|nr:serine/threonine protein kinase [Gigaspora margarita]